MARDEAPLAHLVGAREDAIHRADRADVASLVEKLGIDLTRRFVTEALVIEQRQDRRSFLRG